MNKLVKYSALIAIATLASMPLLAVAQVDKPGFEAPTTAISSVEGVVCSINVIANWFFALLMAFAVLFILLAAYSFLTAQGDESKLKTARAQVTAAIWGIIIAILAKSLITIVANFFNVTTTSFWTFTGC